MSKKQIILFDLKIFLLLILAIIFFRSYSRCNSFASRQLGACKLFGSYILRGIFDLPLRLDKNQQMYICRLS